MRKPDKCESTITWQNPDHASPPMNQPILAIVASSVDRGYGFKRHHEIMTLKILVEDADGNCIEGAEMLKDLSMGHWGDFQFRVVSTSLDDELDFYSNSIEWWAIPPAIGQGWAIKTIGE